MRDTLLRYDEWERFIPTDDVGLHKNIIAYNKTNSII